ncbi:hypothetical protein I306_00855 [Cryptococcus gattii EJB2]|uniref:Uncharacterized protein n=1 Tax=Cryptococcus gattii EJB2 TaxID=1296103 RepID=A0ABR5C2T8_9TREE|nr:hypothetical protein I306_00855 [Cryptococcus gattii EJB2]
MGSSERRTTRHPNQPCRAHPSSLLENSQYFVYSFRWFPHQP